jgi:hypothetical protein
MKLLKVVINRAKWDVSQNHKTFGNWFYETYEGKLIRKDGPGKGLQCCLGFVGRVCKIKGMLGKGMPEQVPSKKWPKGLVDKYGDNTLVAQELMTTNDRASLSPSEREGKIIKLGREAGIAFSFVGKYFSEKKEKS